MNFFNLFYNLIKLKLRYIMEGKMDGKTMSIMILMCIVVVLGSIIISDYINNELKQRDLNGYSRCENDTYNTITQQISKGTLTLQLKDGSTVNLVTQRVCELAINNTIKQYNDYIIKMYPSIAK